MLFVIGALFAAGVIKSLDPDFMMVAAGLMALAAIAGNTVNYHIGKANSLFNPHVMVFCRHIF